MIKKLKFVTLVTVLSTFSACGTPPVLTTTPGTPLPSGLFAVCAANDVAGRCRDWKPASETCVNPKGINDPTPVVYCADIKNGKWQPPVK